MNAFPDGSRRTLNGTVLVVDDERSNRLYLKKLLESRGTRVLTATDGPSALEIVQSRRPDLVLADVVMPGMDGFELCGTIKKMASNSDIPVIMVTAKRQFADLKKGFDFGASDYIRKPFDAREMVLRVGTALALKRSREALARWKRRMSHELELAGLIQRSIFSEDPCFRRDFEIRVKYRASMDIGGDAFDVVELPEGRCCVYLADVSGHGVAPAMISSLLKASATELVRTFYSRGPAYICNKLHKMVCRALNNSAYYATLFMALYEPEQNRWVCMNCGHPDPILVRRGRPVPFPQGGGGVPIGMSLGPERPYREEDQVFVEDCVGLQMLLYTDGLSEVVHRETGEECGAKTLQDYFAEAVSDEANPRAPDALFARMRGSYVVGSDDCTAMVIRMTDPDSVLLETGIPVNVDSVSEVCEQMERLLLTRVCEDVAARVRLVAMEHAMNVVEHSGLGADDQIWVQLCSDGAGARLLLSDAGRAWEYEAAEARTFDVDDYAEGGRGLAVTQMAADSSERYWRDHKNVVCYHFKKAEEWGAE